MEKTPLRFSRAVLPLVVLVWIVGIGGRLYPHFRDELRLDGRTMSFEAYVHESCGERVGPDAARCLEEARTTGHRLVGREQAKSLFLIEAPLWLLLLFYMPWGAVAGRRPTKDAVHF